MKTSITTNGINTDIILIPENKIEVGIIQSLTFYDSKVKVSIVTNPISIEDKNDNNNSLKLTIDHDKS